jgi:hypothetical protein
MELLIRACGGIRPCRKNTITEALMATAADAAGGAEAKIVHVPSDAIAAADPVWGAALLGDSAHSLIFDNSKLRSVVPDYVATITLERAVPEIIAWHDQDPARQKVNADLDTLMDKLAAYFRVRG